LFPHSRSANSEEEMEEERRLCYVAITRAQNHLFLTHAMRRRTWGEELAAEPSRFLNEIPLELLKDVSLGPSWLKFSSRPDTQHNRQAAAALRGEAPSPVKKTSNYTGKTYNSVESIRDFFKKRIESADSGQGREDRGGQSPNIPSPPAKGDSQYKVNMRVKHAKYGQGMILRIEGAGDDAKLTVSFPGFGLKKFVAKYAGLEKA
jgi:DNA helicase-2/ATP-dependent DNA helicase PcrA